jgi:hypothetical protein
MAFIMMDDGTCKSKNKQKKRFEKLCNMRLLALLALLFSPHSSAHPGRPTPGTLRGSELVRTAGGLRYLVGLNCSICQQ